MNGRQLFILLVFLAFSFLGNGQIINIDKSDTADYSKQTKTNLNIAAGVEIDKQKQTLYDASNLAELMVQRNKELFLLAASYRFTYNGPDDILNSGYIHLRYRHNYKNKFQPETYIQYLWDNKRGLERRLVTGANIRYNFWKGGKIDLNAGAGLFYENERWDYVAVDSVKLPSNTSPVTNKYIKINAYVRLDWKASANSDLSFHVFVQCRPDGFKPRIAPHIQWNIMAGKHFGFTINVGGLYDAAPVVPIERFYYSLANSLLVKF